MTTTQPLARSAAPARPIVPQPLWERRDLFQEPVYAAGLELLEDGWEDDDRD